MVKLMMGFIFCYSYSVFSAMNIYYLFGNLRQKHKGIYKPNCYQVGWGSSVEHTPFFFLTTTGESLPLIY